MAAAPAPTGLWRVNVVVRAPDSESAIAKITAALPDVLHVEPVTAKAGT
jgi:hypothetical protein